MSYATLAVSSDETKGDFCPGKYEVWSCKPDGNCSFVWCAESCPSPWKSDVWMASGQQTCDMPESDYQSRSSCPTLS